MTNESSQKARVGGKELPFSYSRVDRWCHTNDMEGRLWIQNTHCKTDTTPPPIGVGSTHYPVEITIDDNTFPQARQYRRVWRMNVNALLKPENKASIINDMLNTYNRIANLSPQIQTDEWEEFKGRCKRYLQGKQRSDHRRKRERLKAIHAVLQPTMQYTVNERRDAA